MNSCEKTIKDQNEMMKEMNEKVANMQLAADEALRHAGEVASKLAEQDRIQAESAKLAAQKKIDDANRAIAEKQEEAKLKGIATLKALEAEKNKPKSSNIFDSLIQKQPAAFLKKLL